MHIVTLANHIHEELERLDRSFVDLRLVADLPDKIEEASRIYWRLEASSSHFARTTTIARLTTDAALEVLAYDFDEPEDAGFGAAFRVFAAAGVPSVDATEIPF